MYRLSFMQCSVIIEYDMVWYDNTIIVVYLNNRIFIKEIHILDSN